jgi:hypothetical protein
VQQLRRRIAQPRALVPRHLSRSCTLLLPRSCLRSLYTAGPSLGQVFADGGIDLAEQGPLRG